MLRNRQESAVHDSNLQQSRQFVDPFGLKDNMDALKPLQSANNLRRKPKVQRNLKQNSSSDQIYGKSETQGPQ